MNKNLIFGGIIVLLVLSGVIFIFNQPQEDPSLENFENNEVEEGGNQTEQIEVTKESQRPILKNLGVNINTWDKTTNLAGDLIFDKSLLFDDVQISNDGPFVEFGHVEKNKPNSSPWIEYWFFVPLETKIQAPTNGVVSIFYIEHSEDWIVSIQEEGSEWIVSLEHILNLEINDGDAVKAGDIVGEAGLRYGVAFIELAIWTGGDSIFKYCPFDFLEESLKPIYEQKINQLANDWEEFIGQDVYQQEDWVSPGCLVKKIQEK